MRADVCLSPPVGSYAPVLFKRRHQVRTMFGRDIYLAVERQLEMLKPSESKSSRSPWHRCAWLSK